MPTTSYDPRSIAQAQLETALRLYLNRDDLISALTLAGAAEEILGKMLREKAFEPSFDSLKRASTEIHRRLFEEELGAGDFADRANNARNRFKHYSPGQGAVTLDLIEETRAMLDRAVSNYWLLEHDQTSAMEAFVEEQRRIS